VRGAVHQPLAVDQPLVRVSQAGDATGRDDTPHCQTANAGSDEYGDRSCSPALVTPGGVAISAVPQRRSR
jgi:hypothetical protein